MPGGSSAFIMTENRTIPKKNTELVSVLMTVYNTDPCMLKAAVDSILNQSYKEIELVIIDDASEDEETIDSLNHQISNRIRVYRNEKNIGLTKSLNVGLRLCRGRYIARLDADDISMPDRIIRQYRYLKRKHIALLGSGCFLIPSGRRVPLCAPELSGYSVAMIFSNQGPCHSSFFIDKKALLDRGVRYDEKYETAQDYALLCECVKKKLRIGVYRRRLVKWREHETQISSARKSKQDEDAREIRTNYIRGMFVIDEEDLKEFSRTIDSFMYEKDICVNNVTGILHRFMSNNPRLVVSMEVYRFWLIQSWRRLKYKGKSDFFLTSLFLKALRIDRLIYSVLMCAIERMHYILPQGNN